jgi:glycosyltransferase involved in cell wall biosynthesis
MLEAMAARKPVVASNCGGIPEMVDHGLTGWLVPPTGPDALGQAISSMNGSTSLASDKNDKKHVCFTSLYPRAGTF